MRSFRLALFFLLTAIAARAQFTLVSGTVKDPIGLPYAGGTITAVLNISGSPVITATGQAYTPPTGLVQLDLNGNFSMQLAQNSALSPGGSTWTFITCSTTGTVLGAWGTNSACYRVTALTISGSSQNISRQLQTAAQPLTYSASVIATDSPTCAKLAGPVELDTGNLDATGQVTLKASSLGSLSVVGVAVAIPASGCLGQVQMATSLVVPCVTHNASTVGHFVIASTSVTGECDDAGASTVTGAFGQVMRANTGADTVSMILLENLGGGGGGGGGSGTVLNGSQYQSVTYPLPGVTTTVGPGICFDNIALNTFTCPEFDVTGTGPFALSSPFGIAPGPPPAVGNSAISVDVNGNWCEFINGTAPCIPFATGTTPSTPCGITGQIQLNNNGAFGCSSMIDDLVHSVLDPLGINIQTTGGIDFQAPNDGTTGTILNRTACDNGAGALIVCSRLTSTTNAAIGFIEDAAGTTGNGTARFYGYSLVTVDNGASAGHYAIQSTTTDGELHDTGSTTPTAGQPNYFIFSANAGPGTNAVIRLTTGDDIGLASRTGKGTTVFVNGSAVQPIVNFNGSTPSVPANSFPVVYARSNSGNTTNTSASIAGDGNATHCFLGDGTVAACPGGGGGGANKISFDQCSPGETSNPGNVAWTTTNFGGSVWDAGHWEFVGNTNADVFCSVRIPSNLSGTPHIILDFFSASSSAGQTVVMSTCDATTASQQLNVGSLTCAATQNYVSTATAYAMTELDFTVQSTAVIDQYLIVQIHQATAGPNIQLMMEPPKLKVF